MLFKHDPEIIERYPGNYTGLLTMMSVPEDAVLQEAVRQLMSLVDDATLSEQRNAAISQWREIFTRMGAKKGLTSSVESLANYWSRKCALYQISPIVDFYNWYSLVHGVPMAAYDSLRISWPLCLTNMTTGKTFTPLNHPGVVEVTMAGEVAYVDAERVICRYWNLQDCDHTKITRETVRPLFVFDIRADGADHARARFRRIGADFSAVFGELAIKQHELTGAGVGVTAFDGLNATN